MESSKIETEQLLLQAPTHLHGNQIKKLLSESKLNDKIENKDGLILQVLSIRETAPKSSTNGNQQDSLDQ
jgi:hypothetical protein